MTNRLDHYEVSILYPTERTNLITNPSFELDAETGYTASGAGVSIDTVTTYSRRGYRACEVTTATGVVSGLYYAIALTSGTQYSFSADIRDVSGQSFTLAICTAGDVVKTSTTWTGTGYWRRRSVTWTADASATFRLYITRAAVASTTKFHIDGCQLEVGEVTTYLDGDMTGSVVGQTAYRWNGTPHASTSWRSRETRTGGTYVKFSTYARIIGIIGLGMPLVNNIANPSVYGGSFFQNSVFPERQFTVVANINSAAVNGDMGAIHRARAALQNACSPQLTTIAQPLLMQIDQFDSSNVEIAETLEVECLYQSGLDGNEDMDGYNDKFAASFKLFSPLLNQQGEHAQALGYQTEVANANYILKRGSDGTWAAMASGTGATVNTAVAADDGSLYIGGSFTDLTDANGDRITKWNGTAFSSLGTGMQGTSKQVIALALGADGALYAGGIFDSAGGQANTKGIAKWDGANWTALGTGITNGTGVFALAIDPNTGDLYAGGNFVEMGGVAATDYLAKWDGSTWSSVITGIGVIQDLLFDNAGNLYIGGTFTNAGDANGDNIVKWNGSALSSLGTGANQTVRALAKGADGAIYVGGDFTLAGGVTNTAYIAKWNGTSWSALGTGLNNSCFTLAFDESNNLFAGGYFTTAGGVTLPDKMAKWNGATWMPIDINLANNNSIYSLVFDKGGNFYVGGDFNGSATSATVTATTVSGSYTYPKVVFTGPGTVYQLKNYTTGKAIYFNLTLLAGETATLDLDPKKVRFKSNFRGNILSTILPGSNLDFNLIPGANNISSYIYGGTTAASGIVMTWRDTYLSMDGATH